MKHSTRARSFLKLPLVLAMGVTGLAAQQASAHGYIETPKARSFMCSSAGGNLNANCGAITYEPQSVEYIGRPGGGSHFQATPRRAPVTLPNAAQPTAPSPQAAWIFSELNEQSATRWAKNTIARSANLHLKYTAGHATRYWQFYITKKTEPEPAADPRFVRARRCWISHGLP
ncbi:lytic polysaccharide monooxygenase [Pseudomonas protegens]|uniref:lytic polysaccharide monooxygenase n=1 Tax=Pseudomonas protegens TaxID=380021 RepID=UPI0021AEFEC4|nr:lytic polysaccharide monooxygenase [Pseudomonas protegens]